MANDSAKPTAWLSSQEARKQLRISSCELMHLREAGKLRFKKQGNAFLYSATDVERQRQPAADTPPTCSRHS